MTALDRLIIALDFPSQKQALELVDRLDGSARWFKVGLELYLTAGASIVDALRARDFQVFLDLKLHDIPNTVAAAVRVCGNTGASLLTVHAAGGPAMLGAAVAAAPASLQVLAVTVLTSLDSAELRRTGIAVDPQQHAVCLGEMSATAGVHGLVCSPKEIKSPAGRRSARSATGSPGHSPGGVSSG